MQKMFAAKVKIRLKSGVLDPQGKAVKHGLASLGFHGVEDVRIGKFIELKLAAASKEEAEKQLKEMSEKLLANTIMEQYQIELTGE